MEKYPHLKNAPITEAIIDFRVIPKSNISFDDFQNFEKKLETSYPSSKTIYKHEANLEFDVKEPSVSSKKESKSFGKHFISKDGKFIFLPTFEGFTVSRLKPYETWEELKMEAMALWENYNELVNPKKISRISLRYINHLELPPSFRDLKDYLTAPPDVPPRLPQTLINFFTRIVIPIKKTECFAGITQKFDYSGDTKRTMVILDIDVFKSGDFEGNGIEAWNITEILRKEKNRIFFESITENMEELCQ